MSEPHDGVPGAPPPSRRPINATAISTGLAIALLGHVLALVLTLVIAPRISPSSRSGAVLPVLEILNAVICLATGVALIVGGNRGVGVGLLIGWAVLLMIGGGVCVYFINTVQLG